MKLAFSIAFQHFSCHTSLMSSRCTSGLLSNTGGSVFGTLESFLGVESQRVNDHLKLTLHDPQELPGIPQTIEMIRFSPRTIFLGKETIIRNWGLIVSLTSMELVYPLGSSSHRQHRPKCFAASEYNPAGGSSDVSSGWNGGAKDVSWDPVYSVY